MHNPEQNPKKSTASAVSVTFSSAVSVTIDVCFQVLNSLLLSGMIGAQSFDLKQFRRLAEVSGFGFASERIAFPGKINPAAKDCIVSFPGKYSKEWDEAVEAVKEETSVCSLACVFLTDTASGLGQHANLPNKPEECWCHTIYGEFPASTYLSIVDVKELKPDEVEAEVLLSRTRTPKLWGKYCSSKEIKQSCSGRLSLLRHLSMPSRLVMKTKAEPLGAVCGLKSGERRWRKQSCWSSGCMCFTSRTAWAKAMLIGTSFATRKPQRQLAKTRVWAPPKLQRWRTLRRKVPLFRNRHH